MADLDVALPDGLALLGALAVVVGTYLPWIVPAPGTDVVPAVYLPGMETGVAVHDYPVLGTLAVGLAAAARERDRRRGGYLAAATGALIALATVGYAGARLAGGVTFGVFVPGPGVHLTVAGGLLLVAAGWRHLAAMAVGEGLAPSG